MMNGKQLKTYIKKAAGDRTKLIDSLLGELEKSVSTAQRQLLNRFITEWVEKLDVDETTGTIKNTLRNKRMLATVDKVFTDFIKTDGVQVAQAMVEGVAKILDFNGRYYKGFNTQAELIPIKPIVQEYMKSWLGLKGNGALEGNGYLQKTISDPKVLGALKDLALRSVSGQQGYQATKKAVGDFIGGNKQSAGLLQKYYRNFVYDTYSNVDRATAEVYSEKLKLDYAVFEGGLIKTSRKF